MPAGRHCKHCWTDCDGTCLLPGAAGEAGLCIHKPIPKLPFRQRAMLLGQRRFWHRVLTGTW
jgi:hypothetical protein